MKRAETHKDGSLILEFVDAGGWHQWLHEHYGDTNGIWIKLAKKGTLVTTLSYNDAVDEALCYGWIDSLVNRYDATYYIQKFTPRRPRSNWSSGSRESVQRLTEMGRMQPSGQATVDLAKADGRWPAS